MSGVVSAVAASVVSCAQVEGTSSRLRPSCWKPACKSCADWVVWSSADWIWTSIVRSIGAPSSRALSQYSFAFSRS